MPLRVGLIVFVALAGLALPLAAPAAPTDDPNARILRVERWLKAVLSHQPGRKDDAISEVAAWSNADLRTLGVDERVLLELMQNPAAKQVKAAIPTRNGRPLVTYTPWQLHRLRVLSCAGSGLVSGRDCRDLNAGDEIDARLSHLANLAAQSSCGRSRAATTRLDSPTTSRAPSSTSSRRTRSRSPRSSP